MKQEPHWHTPDADAATPLHHQDMTWGQNRTGSALLQQTHLRTRETLLKRDMEKWLWWLTSNHGFKETNILFVNTPNKWWIVKLRKKERKRWNEVQLADKYEISLGKYKSTNPWTMSPKFEARNWGSASKTLISLGSFLKDLLIDLVAYRVEMEYVKGNSNPWFVSKNEFATVLHGHE